MQPVLSAFRCSNFDALVIHFSIIVIERFAVQIALNFVVDR